MQPLRWPCHACTDDKTNQARTAICQILVHLGRPIAVGCSSVPRMVAGDIGLAGLSAVPCVSQIREIPTIQINEEFLVWPDYRQTFGIGEAEGAGVQVSAPPLSSMTLRCQGVWAIAVGSKSPRHDCLSRRRLRTCRDCTFVEVNRLTELPCGLLNLAVPRGITCVISSQQDICADGGETAHIHQHNRGMAETPGKCSVN